MGAKVLTHWLTNCGLLFLDGSHPSTSSLFRKAELHPSRRIISQEDRRRVTFSIKTKAASGSSYYMAELFPDETWNVIWFKDADDSRVIIGKRLGIPQLIAQEFQELKEEVGTDNTVKMAEALRKKDTINKKAEALRNLLHY